LAPVALALACNSITPADSLAWPFNRFSLAGSAPSLADVFGGVGTRLPVHGLWNPRGWCETRLSFCGANRRSASGRHLDGGGFVGRGGWFWSFRKRIRAENGTVLAVASDFTFRLVLGQIPYRPGRGPWRP